MTAKLYALSLSHPAQAARRMLEHKGIDHKVVNLLAGVHDIQLRLAGFKGTTVPALKLDDGRRLQHSLEIPRVLDELKPDPPLYPADPERRRAVEEAEQWGEEVLQAIPRRLLRVAFARDPALRRWFAAFTGLPLPALVGPTLVPIARRLARRVEGDEEHARADLAAMPGCLDHVDELLAKGVIGGPELNAADCQIGAAVRVLMTWDDTRPYVEGRPCAEFAMRVFPTYAGPVPRSLPSDWMPPVGAGSVPEGAIQ